MTATIAPTDKRRLRGEESRKLILQAAISSIAALGLGSMTLDRVAERVGISRGLVVFHFKSKTNLLETVLNYLGKQYAKGWEAACVDDQNSNIEKLLRIIDFDIRFAYQNPKYVSAWHAFWGEARGNQLYHYLSFPRDQIYGDQIEKLIEAIAEEGGYDKQATHLVTLGLNAMLFGIWVESHLSHDPDDCEAYLSTVRIFLARSFPNHPIKWAPG